MNSIKNPNSQNTISKTVIIIKRKYNLNKLSMAEIYSKPLRVKPLN